MYNIDKLIDLQIRFNGAVQTINRLSRKSDKSVSEEMYNELVTAAESAGELARICKGRMPQEEKNGQ